MLLAPCFFASLCNLTPCLPSLCVCLSLSLSTAYLTSRGYPEHTTYTPNPRVVLLPARPPDDDSGWPPVSGTSFIMNWDYSQGVEDGGGGGRGEGGGAARQRFLILVYTLFVGAVECVSECVLLVAEEKAEGDRHIWG